MRTLLVILIMLPLFSIGQNLGVKIFRTHAGNGSTSQYANYPGTLTEMDKLFSTAYSNTTLHWSGTMAISTALNWAGSNMLTSAGATVPGSGDYFSMEVSGTFTPVETGTYTFGVNSDDGGDIVINGSLVVSYYGGHGMGGPMYGSVYLTAGTAYAFKARMQEYGGGEGLAVVWKRPSQGSYTLQPTELGYVATNTISGTVTVPVLGTYPSISLYKVVNNIETFVETKTVASNGTYSFTVTQQNTIYKLVPSLTVQGVTAADFTLVWGEAKNINTPSNTASGLVMTGTRQWKAGDVNRNGMIDLGDAFLILAHTTGLRTISDVLWFSATSYDSITRTNFSSVTPVTSFTVNLVSSNITQNIKYCILGDVNLSHSSN